MLGSLRSENYRLKVDQVLQGLSQEEYNILVSSGVTHAFRKGEVIFREGGIPTGIYYVKQGRVKKYTTTNKGAEQILYICGHDEILGYHALLGDSRYPDSAATLEPAEITFIPKDPFLQVLKSSTSLSNHLLKALGNEFTFFISSMTSLATKTVKERLAINLLILEGKYRLDSDPEIDGEIVMSRTDLANLVGTAKETLVRLLHDFAEAGMIEKTGTSIKLRDKKKLTQVANLGVNGYPG